MTDVLGLILAGGLARRMGGERKGRAMDWKKFEASAASLKGCLALGCVASAVATGLIAIVGRIDDYGLLKTIFGVGMIGFAAIFYVCDRMRHGDRA